MAASDAPPLCAECGFDSSSITPGNAVAAVRSLGRRYHAALDGEADARLRQRPEPGTWSALEYAAHVRDVVAFWSWALHRTLREARPRLPEPDPELGDRTAVESDYGSQDPLRVEQGIAENGARMARKVATMAPDQWQRSAFYGEVEITALWIVRHVSHEAHHHVLDIQRVLGGSGQPESR